jgi:subtilase family serine protease
MRWYRKLKDFVSLRPTEKRKRLKQRVLLQLEELETRALLSVSHLTPVAPAVDPANNRDAHPLLAVVNPQFSPQQSPAISGYTPQQIQQAYGVNKLLNNGTNGKGETIAIVDAYYDPNILSDANTFNKQFNLPLFNSSGGPTLKVVASGGGSASSLNQDPTGDWPLETSLDVEWAHAIAPQANILLVETADDSDATMFKAVQWAATQPGVVAVSMSWGDNEFSSESSDNSYFIPPPSNPGVTFVAASGDYSAPTYPATSPYVLAVGGTTLHTTTNSSGGTVYGSESGWSGSGGGPAQYEGYPSYQYNQPWIAQNYGYPYNVEVYNYATGTYSYYSSRMAPDVAYNADPNTGYAIYDSIPSSDYGFSGGWTEVGGTSAGAPQWSALVTLADQQRAAVNEKPLDTNEVLNQLYNALGSSPSNPTYTSIFHDITTGSNGYSAGPGYDLVTGLGTPIANNLVPYLASTTIPLGQLPTIQGSGYGNVYGTTSAGFGSATFTSFTSFSGFTAGGQPGGGLYTGSGSLSIPPNSAGANSMNSQNSGVPVASATPQVNASPTSSVASSTFSISTLDTAPFNAATGENNFLGQTPTLLSSSPWAAAGGTPLAPSTTGIITQGNNTFGASGWNGLSLAWRSNSLDLPALEVEQPADVLSKNLEDANHFLADDAAGTNDDATGEGSLLLDAALDAFGEDLSALGLTAPAHSEDGEASGSDG